MRPTHIFQLVPFTDDQHLDIANYRKAETQRNSDSNGTWRLTPAHDGTFGYADNLSISPRGGAGAREEANQSE